MRLVLNEKKGIDPGAYYCVHWILTQKLIASFPNLFFESLNKIYSGVICSAISI